MKILVRCSLPCSLHFAAEKGVSTTTEIFSNYLLFYSCDYCYKLQLRSDALKHRGIIQICSW